MTMHYYIINFEALDWTRWYVELGLQLKPIFFQLIAAIRYNVY